LDNQKTFAALLGPLDRPFDAGAVFKVIRDPWKSIFNAALKES